MQCHRLALRKGNFTTDYLKKSKMYELACCLTSDVPKMKYCEYKFYRGSEWLEWYTGECCDDGYISCQIYRCRSFVSFERIQHLDSEFKAVTLKRFTCNVNEVVPA